MNCLCVLGTQPLLPSIQHEDAATEKRIAHILSEAQQAMQQKKSHEQAWSKEVGVSVVMATSKKSQNV